MTEAANRLGVEFSGGCRESGGFALVMVLWIIGLMSLVVLTISWATRLRVEIARNALEATSAEKIADAAFSLVQLRMRQTTSGDDRPNEAPLARGPIICTLSHALLILLVENEAGKVDLNIASEETLANLFHGAGATPREAQSIAAATVEYRSVSSQLQEQRDGDQQGIASTRPKRAPFDSILELDQVYGMRRGLFEAILPFVTVSAHRDGPDPDLSPPGLSAALKGASAFDVSTILERTINVTPTAQAIEAINIPGRFVAGGSYLVHAEVSTAGGGYFVREAAIELLGESTMPRISEWRQGRERYRQVLSKLTIGNTGFLKAYPKCGIEL